MMKSICLLSRKEGANREAFHGYYESNHAPLAIGLFPFRKYVRNHLLLDADLDLDFDTISEFWFDDVADILALMKGDIGARMKADEIKFMNQTLIRSSGSEEHLLRGPRRGSDDGAAKTAILLKRAADVSPEAFRDAVKVWGAALPANRVSLDIIIPWAAPWPSEAVVWMWGATSMAPPPPAGTSIWRTLDVSARETSPDTLP